MSEISVLLNLLEFVRTRTLATLDEVARLPDPAAVLCWQPGPGRAHLGWQLTHIGITEELTATERLNETQPAYADLVPRFKVGSVPDDNVPDVETIRSILNEARNHLVAALSKFNDADLETIPKWYTERGWTVRRLMQILVWHESHHQGQAHLTLNLWKAGQK
jgi:DinB superfamily